MATMVQCPNPARCGVQSHIQGSEQERACQNGTAAQQGKGSGIPGMTLATPKIDEPFGGDRDLSIETPATIDEEIRQTENAIIDCNWDIFQAEQLQAKYDAGTPQVKARLAKGLTALNADRDKALVERRRLRAELDALENEYFDRSGWTRYFLATNNNGHVHSSTECSTCNNGRSATEFSWKTSFSGKPNDEVVELMGEKACTVCYPNAPVEVREKPYNMYSEEERAEIDRERAEKEAEKTSAQQEANEKGIWNPDGSALVLHDRSYMRTQRAAEIRATQGLASILWYNQIPPKVGTPEYDAKIEGTATYIFNMSGNTYEAAEVIAKESYREEYREHPSTDEWKDDADRIAHAVAAKTGETYQEVMLRFRDKAIAKNARDGGYDNVQPLDWVLE